MKLSKTVMTVGCVALMGAAFAPSAKADEWNRKTVITFSGPVEIPGVHLAGWGVLPAGTYVFKVLDSASNRHIVQVFDKDEKTIYATILAIPNYRLKATDKTVMTFSERPAGQPEAIRAWFYPGKQWGDEFVYPKSRAIELAKLTNTPVLFSPVTLPVEVAQPITSRLDPVVVELVREPVMAVTPAGDEVQLAQVVTPVPVAEFQDNTPAPAPAVLAQAFTEPETLPATASKVPLIALFGLLALGSAFAVRAAARRIQ